MTLCIDSLHMQVQLALLVQKCLLCYYKSKNTDAEMLCMPAVCLYHSIQSFTRDCDSEGDSAICTSSHTSPHIPSAATSSSGSPAKLLIMLWPHTHSHTHTPTHTGDPTDVHALPAGERERERETHTHTHTDRDRERGRESPYMI
jgi:hypothetical protein